MISWSSLDWGFSDYCRDWHWHLVLGTLFDTMVHAVNTYLLSQYLTRSAMLFTMATSTVVLGLLLSHRRFAWSSPSSIPGWVRKRVQHVPDENYAALAEVLHIVIFVTGAALIYNAVF